VGSCGRFAAACLNVLPKARRVREDGEVRI
jgi:hypothetical protein